MARFGLWIKGIFVIFAETTTRYGKVSDQYIGLWVGHAIGASSAVVSGGGFPRQALYDRLWRGGADPVSSHGAEILAAWPYLHFTSSRRPLLRFARAVVDHVSPSGGRTADDTYVS